MAKSMEKQAYRAFSFKGHIKRILRYWRDEQLETIIK
jgi:hypothetical protein